ncbi:hypothetical protein AAY473_022650 [Plecturocebus cupreus]
MQLKVERQLMHGSMLPSQLGALYPLDAPGERRHPSLRAAAAACRAGSGNHFLVRIVRPRPNPAAAFPPRRRASEAAGGSVRLPGERPARPGAGSLQRFKTQHSGTPTPPAPSPIPRRRGRGKPLRLQGRGPEPVRAPAPAAVPPVTQVRRARPKSRPTSPGTCRARSPQDLCSPRFGGPRPVPAPQDPAPAAVSTTGPAAAAAHFRFPRTAGAALLLGNYLKPPPRPARPRPASSRPSPLPGQPGLGSAYVPAPRPRRPTPASARGKGNRRRLAVSARAHAPADGGRRLRGGGRSASWWTTQVRAGRASRDPAGGVGGCSHGAHPPFKQFNSCTLFSSTSGAVTFYALDTHPPCPPIPFRPFSSIILSMTVDTVSNMSTSFLDIPYPS